MTEEITKIDSSVRCPECGHRLASFALLMEHQKSCGKGKGKVISDGTHPFVHIHSHTEFSILDGVGELKGMVEKAAALNMPALAITDHGSVSGHVAFQNACQASGVKPIFGCEFYICNDHTERVKGYHHIILLAKNAEGYSNLIKLASIAAVEGFYYKPRIDFNLLEKHSAGLICTTACIGGELSSLILKANDSPDIDAYVEKYKNLFGDDFYIEIQPNRIPDQVLANEILIQIAEKHNIKLVASNDAHYPNEEDWEAHEIILCIKTKDTISNPSRFKFDDNTFYLMSKEEIEMAFMENHGSLPSFTVAEAISNTLDIAAKCTYTIKKQNVVLPSFILPDGFDNASDFLDHLAEKGMEQTYVQGKIKKYSETKNISLEESKKIYADRLKLELAMFHKLGFEKYMLIVWDIYEFCRAEGIAYGPGRGSVAGSLLAYAIGVTTVDPVENGLLFERFLSPARIDMPDVDMDFEDTRRNEVVGHLIEKYGSQNVASIVTFNQMKGKSILKDVARVFDVPFGEINAITPFIVERSGGDARVSFTVQDSIDSFKEVKAFAEKYPDVIKYATRLEGQIRQKSKHACGIVVSETPISDTCPVEQKDGDTMCSFDFIASENMGLLKLDVLGLRTMSIISNTLKMIKKNKGIDIILEEIDLENQDVFKQFNIGNTAGVFQLETPNMTKLCKQVHIDSFEDLVNVNALGRPGTMRSGLAARFIRIKHGKEQAKYIHPLIKPITESTQSILLYQEQIMFVLADIGNFDWSAVDVQRKIISKSQGTAAFELARTDFIKGAIENGMKEQVAHDLYTQMIQFGSYSFNKSHSAAYSTISYWCQWFKVHYPEEFFAAALSQAEGKENVYIKEARKFGVKFKMPDINKSEAGFSICGSEVLCGLNGISGLGGKGIENIISNRPYPDLFAFLKKVPGNKVNKKAVEALIKIGAFCDPLKGGSQLFQDFLTGKDPKQRTLFDFGTEPAEKLAPWTEEQVEQFKSEYYVVPPLVHPIEKYNDFIAGTELATELIQIADVDYDRLHGKNIWVKGIITNIRYANWGDKLAERPTPEHPMYKYYNKYEWNARHCLFDIEDESGFTLCSVYPDKFELYESIINQGIGTPVLVSGGIWNNLQRIYVKEIYHLDAISEKVQQKEQLTFNEQCIIEHPLRKYKDIPKTDIVNATNGSSIIGIIKKIKLHIDKNDNEMAFVDIEDLSGSLNLIFFASDWQNYKYLLEEDSIYIMKVNKLEGEKPSFVAVKIVEVNDDNI